MEYIINVVLISQIICSALTYRVEVSRLNPLPLIDYDKKESIFEDNYNPSYVPIMINGVYVADGLLVRSHNSDINSHITFTLSKTNNYFSVSDQIGLKNISNSSIVFEPETDYESFGVEDPRITYNPLDETYYMFYSAVQKYSDKVVSRLALATTKAPWIKESWIRHGPIFQVWSKSGALLLADNIGEDHYLYWGDNKINCFRTKNLTNYSSYQSCGDFITVRNSSYLDQSLVESGPSPIKLNDGNYFFIYNSARNGVPSQHKSGWDMEYNAFWVIINGKNKTEILQRSDKPWLSPLEPWEKDIQGLIAPNVVFVEAAKNLGNNQILVFFGCGDKYLGAAKIKVVYEDTIKFLSN